MSETVSERPRLFLLPGRDKRIRAGHPWAYSNEIKLGPDEKALEPGTPGDPAPCGRQGVRRGYLQSPYPDRRQAL